MFASSMKILRERIGAPGIIAILALALAMGGTAWAAKGGGLTAKQKNEVAKIAKKFAGAPGPAGPQGPAGPAGKDGSNGRDGSNGQDGTSVASEEFSGAKEGHCTEGGSKFTAASGTTFACNGKKGQTGFTETLPSKKTETGVWSYQGVPATANIPISFNIPLPAPITEASNVIFNEPTNEHCENAEHEELASVSNPEADPGYLCIYKGVLLGAKFAKSLNPASFGEGTSVAGALLQFEEDTGATHLGLGTWAVTAP